MQLTAEIQHALVQWLREHDATYDDLCLKISNDPHERPAASTVSRWVRGKVRWVQPQLGARLIEILGLHLREEEAAPARLGLSNYTLELAHTIEHLRVHSPKGARRVQNFIRDELSRYIAEDNRTNNAAIAC